MIPTIFEGEHEGEQLTFECKTHSVLNKGDVVKFSQIWNPMKGIWKIAYVFHECSDDEHAVRYGVGRIDEETP